MATGQFVEVLYHLDPGICISFGDCQVLNLYHHHAHRFHHAQVAYRRIRTLVRHMGVIFHHLYWNVDILRTRGGDLEPDVGYDWQGDMCSCRDIHHHWSLCHSQHDCDRFGFGRCPSDYPLEHTDEKTGQAPGFWSVVLRLDRFDYHHRKNSLCEQVRGVDGFVLYVYLDTITLESFC
jgi:hypothetical protein